MTEDSSALPWSINRDDYELQEVIGESWRRGRGRRRAGRRVTSRNVGVPRELGELRTPRYSWALEWPGGW